MPNFLNYIPFRESCHRPGILRDTGQRIINKKRTLVSTTVTTLRSSEVEKEGSKGFGLVSSGYLRTKVTSRDRDLSHGWGTTSRR